MMSLSFSDDEFMVVSSVTGKHKVLGGCGQEVHQSRRVQD